MADLVSYASMAQYVGARRRQEDAVAVHSSQSSEPTLAILSDGMGGHEDGDLASRIIIGQAFGELYLAAARPRALQNNSRMIFDEALNAANRRLKENIAAKHISENTGGTLICTSVQSGQLRWLSVGDSLLYLVRDGDVGILNDVHSFGAQLDKLVAMKKLKACEARAHPDRNCLTSAVTGQAVPKVDCPDEALDLQAGDIVILASDGIEALTRSKLQKIVHQVGQQSANDIAAALLEAVKRLKRPDQDNTSVIVIKVEAAPHRDADPASKLSSLLGRLPLWRRHPQDGEVRA